MAWIGYLDRAVTVRHRMGNLLGTGTVSGESANLGKALFKPDGSASGLTVAITEPNSDGYYDATFTATAVDAGTGIYRLRLTNPAAPPAAAATDEAIVDYYVEINPGLAAETLLLLTSVARVKERLEGATGETYTTAADILLQELISETSGVGHDFMGRIIPQQAYSHYFGGDDTDTLWLAQGPLVSVASLESVDRGTGSEVLAAIATTDYFEDGLRTEGWKGRGKLIMNLGGLFLQGKRNYKSVYTAGFTFIPETIVRWATRRVLGEYFNRHIVGRRLLSTGDKTIEPDSEAQQSDQMKRALAPYRFLPASL